MREAFLGEIALFGGDQAPKGWAVCDGQLLKVSEYAPLFSVLGKRFGGDGRTTFGLPDLRGRVPFQWPTVDQIGALVGTETVALHVKQMPPHTHVVQTSNATSGVAQISPERGFWGRGPNLYRTAKPAPLRILASAAIDEAGASEPHDNMQPFIALCFVIAIVGDYPLR